VTGSHHPESSDAKNTERYGSASSDSFSSLPELMSMKWTLESCATNTKRLPEGDQATSCTQPVAEYSAKHCPKGSLLPKAVSPGFLSMPLMKAEKIRALKSLEPVAKKTLLGCHATLHTVDLCFFTCLLTHQSLSSSK